LTERLAAIPMKFIVFIDDLSFSGNDDSFSALKAVLEGGLSARPKNVLVYATSNRRHLVRENFGDRGNDDIHREDTLQETVSLSDRFGIILTFLLPDKKRFLEIIELLAADRGLEIDRKTLLDAAERYALERGARSPRFARQFIAQVQARIGRNKPI
jgi:predicted AAA+ superfamily ATPase